MSGYDIYIRFVNLWLLISVSCFYLHNFQFQLTAKFLPLLSSKLENSKIIVLVNVYKNKTSEETITYYLTKKVSLTQTFSEIDRKIVGLDCHEEGRSNHAKFDGFDAFVWYGITLLWIMTCHQDYIQQRDGVIFQLILNGYQPVETFFCLSGIVLSFRLFPAILRGKDLSAKTFLKDFAISLLRRVIRLLPSIFAVATFSATLLRFLGFGPRSSVLDKYQESCRKYWWKDPLFVDNLVHDDVRLCLSHCWYTSVEMQLFLIVPFVFPAKEYTTNLV
ncbi:Nose resistant to fluoxetine protein 6, partial [Armadillidium nasatum]